jgi:energy-converting hydrogenase A subunit M
MVSINLTNISTHDNEMLDNLKSVLENVSYMDLRVVCYPIGGSFNVDVETLSDVTEEEVCGMVNMLMSNHIMWSG